MCRVFPDNVNIRGGWGQKKDIYRKEEINEYWIVDWKKGKVEIYSFDYDENKEPQYYLFKTIIIFPQLMDKSTHLTKKTILKCSMENAASSLYWRHFFRANSTAI